MSEDQKPKNEPSFEAWVLLYSYLLRTVVPRILKEREQKQEQEQNSSTVCDTGRARESNAGPLVF